MELLSVACHLLSEIVKCEKIRVTADGTGVMSVWELMGLCGCRGLQDLALHGKIIIVIEMP